VLKRTWLKTKDFVFTALPLIVLGSVAVEAASSLGAMDAIVNSFSPVTVGILGLPVATGVALIFGLLRKELALIMLAAYAGTTNFALIMSPAQMFVFTLVMVIYLPCVATLAALIKEYGARRAPIVARI
jgi:ferrous iron transport protein B